MFRWFEQTLISLVHFLVLYSDFKKNPEPSKDQTVLILDSKGSYKKTKFTYGQDIGVYRSCAVQWKNSMYVFGGYHKYLQRQISKVNQCELISQGSLDFDFNDGACTVINSDTVLLCFSEMEGKYCRKSNDLKTFVAIPNSKYKHVKTKIAAIDGTYEYTFLIEGR